MAYFGPTRLWNCCISFNSCKFEVRRSLKSTILIKLMCTRFEWKPSEAFSILHSEGHNRILKLPVLITLCSRIPVLLNLRISNVLCIMLRIILNPCGYYLFRDKISVSGFSNGSNSSLLLLILLVFFWSHVRSLII